MDSWKSAYTIGVPAIDDQHRELFARAEGLVLAMRQGRTAAECAALLMLLRAHCRTSFAAEERLMEETGFAGMVGHLAQHAEFNRRIETIVQKFTESGPSAVLVAELESLVGGWLVKHILALDTQLASFLDGHSG